MGEEGNCLICGKLLTKCSLNTQKEEDEEDVTESSSVTREILFYKCTFPKIDNRCSSFLLLAPWATPFRCSRAIAFLPLQIASLN